jgi:hypothetical protein|tara:strand:- start:346 stop:519 length:174 start_codon:yes stop_codon:yes gene_type:complete
MSNFTLKISNFEYSAPIYGDDPDYEGLVQGVVGQDEYLAPEMLNNPPFYKGVKVDIY